MPEYLVALLCSYLKVVTLLVLGCGAKEIVLYSKYCSHVTCILYSVLTPVIMLL